MKDVHTEHCCIDHGCKYCDPNCTVMTGLAKQSYPCEDCQEDQRMVGICEQKDNLIENLQDEIEALKQWRDLALKFDHHRMVALSHLKALVADPDHKETAEEFLKAPPLPAHEVVAELEKLTEALTKICQIEDELFGGDWDEIEEAREIAKAALCSNCGR